MIPSSAVRTKYIAYYATSRFRRLEIEEGSINRCLLGLVNVVFTDEFDRIESTFYTQIPFVIRRPNSVRKALMTREQSRDDESARIPIVKIAASSEVARMFKMPSQKRTAESSLPKSRLYSKSMYS